jgi:hypothetical protein
VIYIYIYSVFLHWNHQVHKGFLITLYKTLNNPKSLGPFFLRYTVHSTLNISLHSDKNHVQDNRIGYYKPKTFWHSHKSKDSMTQRAQITLTSLELDFGVIM